MSEATLPTGSWSPKWAQRVDRGLVVLLLLPVVVFPFTGIPWLVTALSVVQILPLLVRRARPFLCAALVSAAMLAQVVVVDTPVWGQVALPLAVYSVAAFGSRVALRATLSAAAVGTLLAPWDWFPVGRDVPQMVGFAFVCAVVVVAAWALGMLSRTRQAYVAELEDRHRRLERESAQQAELAASDERARIAREMHDVVAHGLSVMVVQADGARYAVGGRPEAAAEALDVIADTGRESLAEMRRMLGLLRAEDQATGTRPQPGLVDLNYLVEEASAVGMRLTVDLPAPLPDVGSGVGLTTYRVVQEALTNVRKHAGPDPQVDVRVVVAAGAVDVLVEDDGRGASATDDGHGLGLRGMQERVAVHGGTVQATPRPGGGFRVSAHIPLEGAAL